MEKSFSGISLDTESARFVIEGFRTDQLIMPVTGWPVSQALSLVLAVVAAVVVVVKRVKISRQEKMA